MEVLFYLVGADFNNKRLVEEGNIISAPSTSFPSLLTMSANPYVSNDFAQDNAERLTRRVTADIRHRIRKVFPAPELFTNEWFELSDMYQSIATVAVLEERDVYTQPDHYVSSTLLAANGGTGASSPIAGGGAQQVGKAQTMTIWEREDVCVRLVVEEGKTNLMVRTLEDFYAATAGTTQSSASSVPSRLFEFAAGALARCTLTALETLQTLDTRALIAHCNLVLDNVIAAGKPTPATKDGTLRLLSQDGAVIGYLAHVVVQMERLRNEDAIYEQLLDLNIFHKVLTHAELNLDLMSSASFRTAIQDLATEGDKTALSGSFAYMIERDFPANYVIFYSAFIGSEHYKSNPAAIFPGKTEKKRFVTVMEPITRILMPGATVTSDLRKSTRPLTDTILRFK